MARDQIREALEHPPAPAFGGRAVDDHAERIDGLGIDEDAHLDEIAVAIADLVIVEARIAAADRFEPIVEIEHDFVRSEEHTSELQSLMRISYAVFCLKKKTIHNVHNTVHMLHHSV